jgi:hypothetical protein
MKTDKKFIKVVFQHYKKEESQERLDRAFDLLFETLLKKNDKALLIN